MISLDQIQKLETKVTKAVELIRTLRKENVSLTSKLDEYRSRIEEMEILISRFKEDQNEIEQGVMSALEQLDRLEDGLVPDETAAAPAVEPARSQEPVQEDQPELESRSTEDNAVISPGTTDETAEPDSELDIF